MPMCSTIHTELAELAVSFFWIMIAVTVGLIVLELLAP